VKAFVIVLGLMTGATTAPVAMVTIHIERDGTIDMNGRHMRDVAQMCAALKALGAPARSPSVTLDADRRTPYAKVAHVLLALRPLNVKLGIVGTETPQQ
jgi:biopolymer transport protein ExbD